jgi:hypothetical protein
MIKKIYIYNENGDSRIIRTFRDTLTNEEIGREVSKEHEVNFIKCKNESIVFRRYNHIVISLVVEKENEVYCLSLISLFMDLLKRLFPDISELHFIYHFKDIYDLLDKFIVGGIVIETNPEKIIGGDLIK